MHTLKLHQAEHRNLALLETTKIKKQLLYTKQKYWIKSSRTLKLRAYRVKEQSVSKHIQVIRTKQGAVVSQTDKIAQSFHEYYTQLYTTTLSDPTILQKESQNFPVQTKLIESHKRFLD